MRRNNKGFSLVELIVALAIFAIAGVAVFGFTVNSSRLYQRSNTDVKLQYEQQLAVNQIRDMVVESDRGIYFDEASKTLAFYGAVKNEGGGKVYPVTVIRYMQAEGKMYFGTREFSAVTEITFADVETKKLLAEDVTDFNVDLTQVENDKVLFEVSFMVGDRVQTVRETVALRNRLVVSNQVDTIWGDEPIALDSFIKNITISRGSKEFAYDEVDEIGKSNSNPVVVVAYQAKVIANEESSRDYTVSWSLDREITGVGLSVAEGEAIITIATEVPSSTAFYLYATSVDDPTKKTRIQIKVMDFGVYPESMTLERGDVTDGNGFRTYKLIPTLYYTDGTSSSDYNLFTWDGVNSLPAGCTFNKDTGVLTLAPTANGTSIKVKAISKERKADGTVLFKEYTIVVDGITEFVTGPSVKIVAAKNLSRGGTVYPSMVFEGASHSNYTYTWKVEPYYDETTTEFGSVDNSSFDLVSLKESGGYDNYVQHEVNTGIASRSTTLGCAAYLNWTKTFKVKVTGTARDVSKSETNGTVLEATPVVITIAPVKLSIERYGYGKDPYNQEYPSLTNSELKYEQWYSGGDDLATDAAKAKSLTRRWFYIKPENIYITGSNQQNTKWTGMYVYMDATQTLFEWESWRINSIYMPTMMLSGFQFQMSGWEFQSPRPVYMNYALEISDNKGNKILSNTEEFKVVYELYYPDKD